MSFFTKIQEFVKEKLASLKSKKAAPAEESTCIMPVYSTRYNEHEANVELAAVPAPAEETAAAELVTEEAAKPVAT